MNTKEFKAYQRTLEDHVQFIRKYNTTITDKEIFNILRTLFDSAYRQGEIDLLRRQYEFDNR